MAVRKMLSIDCIIRNMVEREKNGKKTQLCCCSGLVEEEGSSLAATHWTDANTRHSDYS